MNHSARTSAASRSADGRQCRLTRRPVGSDESGRVLDADAEPDARVVVGDAPLVREALDEVETPPAAVRARLRGGDRPCAFVGDRGPDTVGVRLDRQLDPAFTMPERVADEL